jgi:hypothetical protein
LSIFVSADHPIDTIKIPTPYEAMQHALAFDGARADPAVEHGRVYPASKVLWTEPSNEARYVTGVLGMTGGLRRASQILLHPFLQDMFASLGGTPNIPPDKMTPTINRLRKRARSEAGFDLTDESDKQALADLILKAARTLKRPMDFFSYDGLKESWKAYRAKYWIANPQPAQSDDVVDWNEYEEQSLDSSLIEMRQRQILFQGHRWTCRKCHHKNWVDLGALATRLLCEVCKQSEQTPVDIRWLFRPNEFLIESLRDHSVLSLVWALSRLCMRSRHSLIFVEPTWFGYDQESTAPDAEADLLVILDGKAMLCEVKSSWHSLRLSHVSDFVALASRLRPDIALLAVMEVGAGPVAEIEAARTQLAAEGIQFELLTPGGQNLEDGPYLRVESEE